MWFLFARTSSDVGVSQESSRNDGPPLQVDGFLWGVFRSGLVVSFSSLMVSLIQM